MMDFLIYIIGAVILIIVGLLFALIRSKLKKDVRYTSQYYLIEYDEIEEKNIECCVNYKTGKKKKNVKAYLNQENKILVLRFERKHTNVNLLNDEFEFFINDNRIPIKIKTKKAYSELTKDELINIIKISKCYKNGISLIFTNLFSHIIAAF